MLRFRCLSGACSEYYLFAGNFSITGHSLGTGDPVGVVGDDAIDLIVPDGLLMSAIVKKSTPIFLYASYPLVCRMFTRVERAVVKSLRYSMYLGITVFCNSMKAPIFPVVRMLLSGLSGHW